MRTDQYIGLTERAKQLMLPYRGFRKGPQQIGVGYGPVFGDVWVIPHFEHLKSPVLIRERVQAVCHSSGPMFFTHLVLNFCADREQDTVTTVLATRHYAVLDNGVRIPLKEPVSADHDGICSWVEDPAAVDIEFDRKRGIYWV